MSIAACSSCCWPCGSAVAWRAAQDDRPQDYRIARWTTAEGLPQNTINDIVALPNGELWLATFGGLVRFDGTDFHVVDIAGDEGLASNRITALALAGTDTFWFVTQEGHLGRIDDGRARAVITADRTMPDVIGLLAARGQFYAQSVDGDIWTSDGTTPWRRSPCARQAMAPAVSTS